MDKLYWVSCIACGRYPYLIAMNSGETSLERAMEIVEKLRWDWPVASAWIDVFHDDGTKETVFHECYIDAFGKIQQPFDA